LQIEREETWHLISKTFHEYKVPLGCHLLFLALVALGPLCLTACDHSQKNSPVVGGVWREFRGTWTAAGTRNIMQLNGDRRASISKFEGSLVLAGPSRPGIGFRSETILFNDTDTGLVGRAVWTDEHADQAFSELRGQGNAQSGTIEGNFIGGTGRYTGITGTYSFSWKFLIENEDGVVQGQSIGLSGRVLLSTSQAAFDVGGLNAWVAQE
jgi:hypothetical protein